MSNGEGECHQKEEMEKSWTSREMIPVIMMMWWYYDMMIKLRWQRQQERQRRWVTHRDKLSRWGRIPGNLHSWLKLCSLVASQLSPPCGRHIDADDDSHDDYDVICKRKNQLLYMSHFFYVWKSLILLHVTIQAFFCHLSNISLKRFFCTCKYDTFDCINKNNIFVMCYITLAAFFVTGLALLLSSAVFSINDKYFFIFWFLPVAAEEIFYRAHIGRSRGWLVSF